jgi:hypothetical protein
MYFREGVEKRLYHMKHSTAISTNAGLKVVGRMCIRS